VPEAGSNIAVSWSFLTNHALVLMYLGRRPRGTGLEIAEAVGITERAARRIVSDLCAAGYVDRKRIGRRNHYWIDTGRPFGYVGERELTIGQLFALIQGREAGVGGDGGARN
jgi:hypothetical protein